MFSKENKEVIPSSLLLTTKLGPTKRNFSLLDNPQVLTNPRTWLKNEPCEIWANGSILYAGKLTITEATQSNLSIRVLINSVAELNSVMLNEVDYVNPIPTTSVFGSAYNSNLEAAFDDYNFCCPRVYNPYAYGEEKQTFDQTSFQNNLVFANGPYSGNSQNICPFPKMTAILRGLFSRLDLSLDNCFDTSDELRRLLVYWANPWQLDRYDSIDIKNHVPPVKASEFLKNWIKHFNLGLIVSSFDNLVRIVKAEDIAYLPAVHDWTKKVLTSYTVTELDALNLNLRMTLPSAVPRNSYELKKYTTVPPEDVKEYLIDQYNQDYVVKRRVSMKEYIHLNRETNYKAGDFADTFESKITAIPIGQIGYPAQSGNTTDFVVDTPMSTDRNTVNFTPDTSVTPMFLFRDSKQSGVFQPTANCDVLWPDGTNSKILGQNAEYSTVFGGTNGVYNKFYKNWVTSLQQSRKIEVQLNLTIADLRRHTFDQKVLIGNIECFVESLDLEFSDNGLTAAKAMLIHNI